MAYATPSMSTQGPVGEGEYTVVQGECVESIAFESGFFWQTIWNHPRNAAIKQARGSPNVLLPGDRLYIPEIRLKTVDRPTDKKHRFVRKCMTSKLRLCLKQVGEPRRKQPYYLVIDGKPCKGKTDGDGCIEVVIPPNAKSGKLVIGDHLWNRQILVLELGAMDPITDIAGVQKRLQNLGFVCEPSGEMDELTSGAIAAFQKSEDLEPTGEINQQTIEKLKERYGS